MERSASREQGEGAVRDSVTPDRTTAFHGTPAPSGVAVRSLAREVVLRLSRSLGDPLPGAAGADDAEVARLCWALTGPDNEAGVALARAALESGLSFDELCELRLAPAARRLGTLWEDDVLSFADVSIAASRLFGILRTLAHRPVSRLDARFAVFAAPPGEEHALGVSMAAERARGAGWEVMLLVGLGHDALVARIADAAPDVIGLTLSSRRSLLPLTRVVIALRIAAPASPIVVCGPGVAEISEPIVGVDAMSADFDGAMVALSRLAGIAG
jgi:MerR family transcriptional regulator, light-induced transcriptional regulator